MSKNILVKFVIFLVVVSLVYSVFWFFKAGQLQKQVESFVSKNSNYISVGEIEVSGFPLMQKITVKDLKFTLPGSLLSKRQTIIKQLEASSSSILSSEFTVSIPEPITVQDSDNNVINVEFAQAPVISFSVSDGMISNFSYQDSGYKLVGVDKNLIYAASSSTITSTSSIEADGSIKTKIKININEVEGFDVVDIYKNLFEKKIADGLKTGEIILGSSVADTNIQPTIAGSTAATDPTVVPAVVTPENANVVKQPIVENIAANTTASTTPTESIPNSPETPAAQPNVDVSVNNTPIKSNFMAELEYTAQVTKDEQNLQIPADPTQVQEIPTQGSKIIKIVSLEFSNQLYKISVNGEANLLSDDALPSGSLAVKIEKVDGLISSLISHFSKITDQTTPLTTPETEVQSVDLVGNATLTEDTYRNFLGKFSSKLSDVTKEVAAKNPVSTENLSEFDIRREKNLEFLINETSVREIFGKF